MLKKKEEPPSEPLYIPYSDHQRLNFISRMLDLPGNSRKTAQVARELGIHVRTAQRWWKNYSEKEELPLKEQHRKILVARVRSIKNTHCTSRT